MIEFAIQVSGDAKGRWVLAVDAASNQVLIVNDDKSLRWVPMGECRVIKAANPEAARPVMLVQPAQEPPKLTVPHLEINSHAKGRR